MEDSGDMKKKEKLSNGVQFKGGEAWFGNNEGPYFVNILFLSLDHCPFLIKSLIYQKEVFKI